MTGLLMSLQTATGQLEWINCGHPPPLLIRSNKVIKELSGSPDPGLLEGTRPHVHQETLQPSDRLLCYTDGVTEARTLEGDLFGVDRLADSIIRTTAAGMSAPEAAWADDATALLIEWRPAVSADPLQTAVQTLPTAVPAL